MHEKTYEEIAKSIEIIKQIDIDDKNSIERIENKLKEREFNLVVMGQFKRGKSTFINSLLGDKILPTAILPLTSIVTIINYAKHVNVLIKYQNDQEVESSLDEIEKYVTEKYNPENKLNVSEVYVFYPSEYLKSGIRIIDTPGVGSVFEHNTDVTYKYLPNCDAAIFMMSPDPPISKAEIEFLRSAKEYIHKFFFILNKKDTVSKEDLQDVMEFNKKLLENELNRQIEIIPISALAALEAKKEKDYKRLEDSNIKSIEEQIIEVLKKEKWRILGLSIVNTLIRYIDVAESKYKLKKRADEMSLEDLEKKIDEFKRFTNLISKYKEENDFVLKGKTDTLIGEIDEHIESLKENNLSMLIKKTLMVFEEKLKQKLKTEQLDKEMKENMKNEIQSIFTEFENEEKGIVAQNIDLIYDDLVQRTNNIIKRIVEAASSIFEVDLQPFVSVEGLSEHSEFSFKFEDQLEALAIIGTFIRKKLPLFMGKIVLEKHIKTTTEEIFDRHCGRMRYAFVQNIQETSRRFKSQLDDKIDNTLLIIKDILDQSIRMKKENEDKVAENIERIDYNLTIVKQVRMSLNKIKNQLEN